MVLTLVLLPAQFLCGKAVRHTVASQALRPVFLPLVIGALHLLVVLPSPKADTAPRRSPSFQPRRVSQRGETIHNQPNTSSSGHRTHVSHQRHTALRIRPVTRPAPRGIATAALAHSALRFPPTSLRTSSASLPLVHLSIPVPPLLSWLTKYILAGAGTSWVARTVKRNIRRNRARRRMMSAAPVNELTVVTFNIRGIMDRWRERAPLLRDCIRELDADVLGFQEVLTGEFQQDRRLLDDGYSIHECRAAVANMLQSGGALRVLAQLMCAMLQLGPLRNMMTSVPVPLEAWREARNLSGNLFRNIRDLAIAPFYGNSLATRLPTAPPTSPSDTLVLGSFRAAQRICLLLPQPATPTHGDPPVGPPAAETPRASPLALWVVNTHLDHAGASKRQEQAQAVCRWMEPLKRRAGVVGVVVMGDLNAPPGEGVHGVMLRHGYVSAHRLVHGCEPEVTWPTGLVAPLMDTGHPHCADYIYVYEAPACTCRPTAAHLAGTRPSPADPTLYPSDHAALRVTLRVGPPAAVNATTGS